MPITLYVHGAPNNVHNGYTKMFLSMSDQFVVVHCIHLAVSCCIIHGGRPYM